MNFYPENYFKKSNEQADSRYLITFSLIFSNLNNEQGNLLTNVCIFYFSLNNETLDWELDNPELYRSNHTKDKQQFSLTDFIRTAKKI